MFEKVNPCHPDKVADRIAGAIVDLAYSKEENPKIAVEVLNGHGKCLVIIETTAEIERYEVVDIVHRIDGLVDVDTVITKQDYHLSENQNEKIRCGDNGIFKEMLITEEQKRLSQIARDIYKKYTFDGKYILDGESFIICQSNARTPNLEEEYPNAKVNPLGDWVGGTNVDTGATNRKLGSDMGDAVTGVYFMVRTYPKQM